MENLNSDVLREKIDECLSHVLDPETGMGVLRMRLVRDLKVDKEGRVVYQFRPSSPLCPIAAALALDIIQAIKGVPGVTQQSITVVDYIQADELNMVLERFLSNNSLMDSCDSHIIRFV